MRIEINNLGYWKGRLISAGVAVDQAIEHTDKMIECEGFALDMVQELETKQQITGIEKKHRK